MSNYQRCRNQFNDNVAGLFDRNDRRIVLDVDTVIIRADNVVIVNNDDGRRGDRFDNEVAGLFDRDDRRDDDRRCCCCCCRN